MRNINNYHINCSILCNGHDKVLDILMDFDGDGCLVATYKYDAFGNILSETGDATLNAINPYRYTSRVWDKETGLYYYRARYYDARNGRFTQKDPLRSELRKGNNLYVYCGNNPVNRMDPTGAFYFEACVATAIANALYIMTDKSMDWAGNYRRHCYVGCMLHWVVVYVRLHG